MKTLAIASIVVAATCGGVAAQAQRLDDRQIAVAPGSTAPTYGTSYGVPSFGGQSGGGQSFGGQTYGGQTGLPPAPPVMQRPPMVPPMIQRVPVPPSGVPSGNIPPAPGMPNGQQGGGQHWGGSIGGHWAGGMQAPGGWRAYRRPSRGFVLPQYWTAPSFFVVDYSGYGLTAPPYGYRWMRYYDDAVLVDGDGRVWDSVRGIDWDRGRDEGDLGGYAYYGDQRRDGPGAGYPPPGAYPPPPPPPPLTGAPIIERHAGQQGYTRTYVAGGTYAGGYWYPPVTTTTITVETAPVITTTTTEYIETSSYRARRVYRAPKRRVVHRRACNCGCGCGS